ncbi:hypothetical protein Tco_0451564 [Tanacetum coccineum]
MLNKENYVPWSSRLLRYAKSRPNGKLIYNSIMNGPYVRRMIPEPGDTDREVPVPATTILLGLPEDIYAACLIVVETAQEILDCSTGYEYGSRQTDADGWSNRMSGIRVDFKMAVQNQGVQNIEDWVILLGTTQSGQGEGMLLIFRLSYLDEIEESMQTDFRWLNYAASIDIRVLRLTTVRLLIQTDIAEVTQLRQTAIDNEIFNMCYSRGEDLV